MKKTIKLAMVTAFSALILGPLLGPATAVTAADGDSSSTIAPAPVTVTPYRDVAIIQTAQAKLYTGLGTNASVARTLPKNSSWQVWGKADVNGQTFYQVAPNQFVSGADISLKSAYTALPANYVVGVNKAAPLYSGFGAHATATGTTLKVGSTWKAATKVTANGTTWYQIGTNQWVSGADIGELAHNAATSTTKTITLTSATPLWNGIMASYAGSWLPKGSRWKVTAEAKSTNGQTWYMVSTNQWINANAGTIGSTYQNPSPYWQIQSTQIQPTGTVGYNLVEGSEGVKTWFTLWWLGLSNSYSRMNATAVNKVKYYQRQWGLPVTGVVDVKFWTHMGFPYQRWFDIDKYIAPLKTNANSTRSQHIEAMISTAYQYLGNPYIVGASSSPGYGTDCSGLVMQSLYSAGINPLPSSSIRHAQPGYEWESRNLWANPQLKKVPYSQRQRGDLIFYYEPGTGLIWHVAIYLGNNQVIESWPPKTMVQPIVNSQRSWIAGVGRPFI
ncbi:SLAP domain-containing protein [Schleiferilactobacillus shenzhenensis]|uniref:NlpC/P60 domain-containing protein n=1 Tax=Schleiferilactobacillus shenzhenensis LY-73 TaxID=1231336 RepID=U4TSV2_9LACO|nr:SLAP domain-containing protein [Schleiferilactobacillus shenzhenensis]ERL64557.1 hypothetical protein L248_0852 [Schleiferilactobacillus shenzhenensis LY-73]